MIHCTSSLRNQGYDPVNPATPVIVPRVNRLFFRDRSQDLVSKVRVLVRGLNRAGGSLRARENRHSPL